MTALQLELDQAFPTHRSELLTHCYRLTGSYHDAEDLVQDTYVRARRGISDLIERDKLRAWLYRIATNACMTALHPRNRRYLPSGLGSPATDPEAELVVDQATRWIEPLPDAALSEAVDPGAIVVRRESLRLALVVALQYLSPRQRAAFLLRETLGWSAVEIATTLEVSVPAVKSLLQRARQRIDEVAPRADDVQVPISDERERDILTRWMRAFEAYDLDAISTLIADDVSIEATTCRTWFQGMVVCLPFFRRALDPTGGSRLVATRVNGQPAAGLYRRDDSGIYVASGVSVLTINRDGLITKINDFHDPALVAAAGLPSSDPGHRSQVSSGSADGEGGQ